MNNTPPRTAPIPIPPGRRREGGATPSPTSSNTSSTSSRGSSSSHGLESVPGGVFLMDSISRDAGIRHGSQANSNRRNVPEPNYLQYEVSMQRSQRLVDHQINVNRRARGRGNQMQASTNGASQRPTPSLGYPQPTLNPSRRSYPGVHPEGPSALPGYLHQARYNLPGTLQIGSYPSDGSAAQVQRGSPTAAPATGQLPQVGSSSASRRDGRSVNGHTQLNGHTDRHPWRGGRR